MISFLFLFLSPRYSSRGARAGEECSEGLKAPDLQVGELRGYRRSDVILCVCIRLNVRLVLIWFQSLSSYTTASWKGKSSFTNRHDSKYVQTFIIIISLYNSRTIRRINNLYIRIEVGSLCKRSIIFKYQIELKCMLILIYQSEIVVIYIRISTI